MEIPFISTPDRPLSSTTQQRIPIADITQDIVVYKDGGASLVLESTSLNFGLLSRREQRAVIASYAGLLNSFNFPVQIVARTQRKDISRYIHFLEGEREKLTNPKLTHIMDDYKNFILEAIKKKNVLSKKFYLVLPFTSYELGVAKSLSSIFKKKETLPYPKSYVIKKAKIALYPKRDHLMRQAARMGIEFRQLMTADLIRLYFNIFNPEPPLAKEDSWRQKPSNIRF
jgi:hypothetical protein